MKKKMNTYCKVFPMILLDRVLVTRLTEDVADAAAAEATLVASFIDISYQFYSASLNIYIYLIFI